MAAANDTKIDIRTTVARNDEIISSDMGEETVMMSIEKGEYYGLDPVGRRIWELVQQPSLVNDICRTLLDEFDVTTEQCEHDVLTFLNRLREKDIIITVDK